MKDFHLQIKFSDGNCKDVWNEMIFFSDYLDFSFLIFCLILLLLKTKFLLSEPTTQSHFPSFVRSNLNNDVAYNPNVIGAIKKS